MAQNNVPICDPRQLNAGDTLYPVPVRLILGIYFILSGFPKLFTVAGHDIIVAQLNYLKIPFPEIVCWGVGSIEFFGGLLLLVGFLTPLAAALNIFSTGGHFLFALMSGQFPSGGFPPPPVPPLHLFQYALPDYGFSLLLMGGLLTLIIGGAGAYSIDEFLADPQLPLSPFQFSNEQKADIQGIVLSGYAHLRFGAYLFLEFKDAEKAKAWIRDITPGIATSEDYESEEIPVDELIESVEAAQAWLITNHPERFTAVEDHEELRRGPRDEPQAFVRDQNHQDQIGQITIKKAKDAIKIKWKPTIRVDVAFTYGGVAALGLPEETLLSFPREFISGMSTRSEILGDIGESAPEHWELGGIGRYLESGKLKKKHFNANAPVHAVLMFAALDQHKLDESVALQKHRIDTNGGVLIVSKQGGSRPPNQQEPFGFHDGISNPLVQGLSGNPPPNQFVVNTGDFVLGYCDGYEIFAPSPMVRKDDDPENILSPMPGGEWPAFHNLGQNGSYIVYRKLEQMVPEFWSYMRAQAGSAGSGEIIKLASKCIGRWPSGAPMVLTPDYDNKPLARNNYFTYTPTDPQGFACPIGAHIRRANPRDSFIFETPEESFQKSRRHRIARRSVSFGPPHPFDPMELERGVVPSGAYKETEPRGIHFFAVNADIPRQFELVQHTWVTLGNLNALCNNKDPIIGSNNPESPNPSHMVIQQDPVRRRLLGLPRFVRVLGGEYFFLPSISALRFLGRSGWSPRTLSQ
jgi:deferrochelatase/peroxidase EfeB/uncharacterized membrane protein YphA (DoxX/SURF4 family)